LEHKVVLLPEPFVLLFLLESLFFQRFALGTLSGGGGKLLLAETFELLFVGDSLLLLSF
jgi:hypothetical protein